MQYCLIFPGQGSQFPGMSKGLTLDTAVDDGLRTLMDNGPDYDLGQTVNAQTAVLSVSVALFERSGLKDPAAVMGHSLGEYTALVASGSLLSGKAIELVKKRAGFMEASRPKGTGGMAAVIGMSEPEVEEVIAGINELWIANLNGADQVVISGSIQSINTAIPLLKGKGAKRVVPLKVSVASHCPYMDKAQEELSNYLKGITMKGPSCPLITNVSARPETDPDQLKTQLARQLTSPVRFEESVRVAARMGIDTFIEIGPRSVLAPLVKRIVPGVDMEVITNDDY
jgi:[acyl-carrier-protein] S-malonyltransferase